MTASGLSVLAIWRSADAATVVVSESPSLPTLGSLVVLVTAGLLARTMMNLHAVPLGYQPEGLIFVETSNPAGLKSE